MKVSKNSLVALVTAMAMAMLTVVTMPSVVHAQTDMQVKIPFDFYVGTKWFPAGDYSVQVSGMYVRVSDRNNHSAFALTNLVVNPESRTLGGAKLMFARYGSYLFLKEVRRAGYSSGNGLIRSNLEITVAKQMGEPELIANIPHN
jgi:hypothetical protein